MTSVDRGGGGGSGGSVTQGTTPWVTSGSGTFTVDEPARVTSNVVYLASAARTATPALAQQTNNYHRGIVLAVNVTSITSTPIVTTRLKGYDPVSGDTFYLTDAPPTITAVGLFVYSMFPGAINSSSANAQVTNGILPRLFTVELVHTNANSITYSAAYSLVGP